MLQNTLPSIMHASSGEKPSTTAPSFIFMLDTATVRSIIDGNSNVTGMLVTSSDTCNVRGDLELMDSGYIHLEYMQKDVDVSDGDMIVTSNISDKYIQGILIGYVKNITEDANSLTQSGYLVPAVDFERLTEVLVIMQLKKK